MLLVALCAAPARAQPDEPAEKSDNAAPNISSGATTLLGEKAPWRWQIITAPRLAPQIGVVAASGLDAVAGRGQVIDVLGEPVPAPSAWPYDVSGDAVNKIPAPANDDQRIAAAFGVVTFALPQAMQGLEVLELRLKYEDGVAVWLNGVELVRQNLPRGPSTTLAKAQHGPEWETFYVPVAPGLLAATNTLAIEVHPSGRSVAPKLSAVLAGRRDRGIVRGPIIAAIDATTATIAVETDAGVEATLEWGTTNALGQKLTSSAARRHRFDLSGLAPNGDVFYRVSAAASRTAVYSFHTMPGKGEVVRIGVYGDVRGGHATHRKITGQMLKEGLDMVAVTGDMVLHGADEADWQRFFAVTRELLASVPYFPAVGNHDLGWGGAAAKADDIFAVPQGPAGRPAGTFWYSRDIGDVHLVFLDSNAYERADQETWLEADLAAARAASTRAIIVFTHDGPYARGYHGGSAVARDRYVPILLKHKVDLLLSGHDHIYQRGDAKGLRYVVSGGGGASLYGIRCGVSGRPKCAVEDGMQSVAKEHHYVVLTIGRDLEMCPRKPDGALLERCRRLRLLR